MKPVDVVNGALMLACLALASVATGVIPSGARRASVPTSTTDAPATLLDASGHPVPIRRYDRIVSASLVSDGILAEIAEPSRVIAVTSWQEGNPRSFRFAGLPHVRSLGELERLIALKPDLVLVTAEGDAGRLARLREAGVEVFDLGHMHGMKSLVANIHQVAALLGDPARGDALVTSLTTRLAALRASVPAAERKRALWLAWSGDALWGGSVGTSYHDVLTGAGLVDAAEEAGLSGWPRLSTERILEIDPPVIVTDDTTGGTFCDAELHRGLRACGPGGQLVVLPQKLVSDPGPLLAEAAEALHVAVYGAPTW